MAIILIILVVLAGLSFFAEAFNVKASVSWTPLGFAFLTAALLVHLIS